MLMSFNGPRQIIVERGRRRFRTPRRHFPPYPTHCELGMTAMVHERQDGLSLRSGAVTGEGWEGDLRTSWMCVYVEVQAIASYLAHRLQYFTCRPIA